MKLEAKINAVLIGVAQSGEYNGKPTYSVSVEQNDVAGAIPCEASIYQAVKNGVFPKYTRCVLVGVYDTNYKNMRVVDLALAEKGK